MISNIRIDGSAHLICICFSRIQSAYLKVIWSIFMRSKYTSRSCSIQLSSSRIIVRYCTVSAFIWLSSQFLYFKTVDHSRTQLNVISIWTYCKYFFSLEKCKKIFSNEKEKAPLFDEWIIINNYISLILIDYPE